MPGSHQMPVLFPRAVITVTAGLALALGLVVMVGWHTHNVLFVQVVPTFAPMQYNAMLGFLLAGLGLLALLSSHRHLAMVCSLAIAIIGVLTISEYLFDVNLGLDQLFLRSTITIKTSHPGRMAPNTALSFVLIGVAILIMSRARYLKQTLLIIGPLGAITLALGQVAFLGYLTGLKTYSWGYYTHMAIHTALGLVLLGSGVIAAAWQADKAEEAGTPQRFPVLVGVTILTVTLCIWQALIAHERALIERALNIASASVQTELIGQIETPIAALIRMAKSWEIQGQPSREVWETETELYLSHFSGIQAVAWVSPASYIRWIVPRRGNENLQDQYLETMEKQRTALELARGSRQVTTTLPVPLAQGGIEFHVYIPIFHEEVLSGYLMAIFHVQTLLDAILGNVAPGYALAVLIGDQELYSRYEASEQYRKAWGQEVALGLHGVTWRVQIWPTALLLARESTALPEVVLIVGLLTAVLLMVAVHLAQMARSHAAQQAAIALENARLYETLEARFIRLQTLTHLNQLISSSLDIHAVLQEIARAAATLVNAPVVSFWIADATVQTLEVRAFSDAEVGADFPVQTLSFADGGVGWVAKHQQSLNVPDVFTDERFLALDWWAAHRLRSFYGLPVMQNNQLIAVLSLNGHRPFTITPDDQQLLANLVAQAAVAIHNARLFAEIQARTTHLVRLNTELHNEITERQRVEAALRESEQRFRSVTQAAHDAIIAADGQGRIIAWNKGAENIFGYQASDVLGQPLTLIMPARYHQAHQAALQRLRHTGQSHLIGTMAEFHGLRHDGSEFPFEISLAQWQAGGTTLYSGVIRDITQRKQAEEQLQRQREALYRSEKLAAMGTLLASVAHELNNPLSVVMMESDLLREEATSRALLERTNKIARAAQRCVRIVQNFLALAREHSPERTAVHLNAVIEEAIELFTYPLQIDNITVQLRLDSDLPPLAADPHQLHQVIVNLITNAHHALRESMAPRQLTITTRAEPARNLIIIEVADTGPGIPPDVQTRIFEPFFTTKPVGLGTGLGLSLCQGIIESHHGTISVESQPGHGTCFRLELPVATTASATVPELPVATAPVEASGKAILLVDDETEITSAIAYLLHRSGYEVETAANGRIALQKLQERPYDLILSDIKMPELDGPGLYEKIEHDYPHLLHRVIFLTGDTLSPDTKTFLERARVQRLNKPFTAADIRRVVQQALPLR